jgi:hypothetical protein
MLRAPENVSKRGKWVLPERHLPHEQPLALGAPAIAPPTRGGGLLKTTETAWARHRSNGSGCGGPSQNRSGVRPPRYAVTVGTRREHAMADEGFDIGKFMRLRGAIQFAMDAVDPGQAAMGGDALARTYERLRGEVREAVHKGYRDEFDRLFPEQVHRGSGATPAQMSARTYNEARSLLGSMAGWLQGFIDEARMQNEVQAFAEARVKAERGVGFKT